MKRIENAQLHGFEMFLREEERSDATIEKYMRDINGFDDFIGDRELCKQSVMEYKQRLSEGYALTSANSMIAAVNAFLRFCGWQELCVKRFRLQRQAYCSEEKELTRCEYLRLIEAANQKRDIRLGLIMQTICATGIRVSELPYITVEALHAGEAVVRCKGKNRRVFIVSGLKKKLLRYVKERKIVSGAVFVTRSGKPISRTNIWKGMKSLCERAQVALSKVFPHNLRHLFARTFYDMEKDIAKLADILGHTSINTTRAYIVTTGAEYRRKMENMHLVI